ncbi:unnamed protein product [Prorocentrum cordatum]|uniref:Peptidylprolyl isomerase n=1 Tax=Prorocentrum cordatum TaxID=2364126 RepID=A0ABN9VUI3_9DINO|nr:unnamed protein product [Polarella glacialis]
MKISERLKEEGNKLYTSGQWSDAVDKYEEACTLIHYCYSTDPGWRKNNRGIDDDVIVFVDDTGSTEEEAAQQRRHRLTCALNIAACKQKLEKYDEVIVACNVCLELDPRNVKALYRRAEARIRPSKATAYDHDLAITDLARAQEADPQNQEIKKLLSRLRAERKVQRSKDAETFTGMFDRGQVYRKEDEENLDTVRGLVPKQNEADMSAIQERIEGISDDDPLEKRCADAELLRDMYMRNGKEEEARELNEKIEQAKQAIRQQRNPEPAQQQKVDWNAPTPEMIEDAKKYGLDLTDPAIIEELKRMEKDGIPPEGSDDAPGASSAGGLGFGAFVDHPSKMPDGPPVPWMSYLVLFAAVFGAWRLVHAGLLRWAVLLAYRRTAGAVSALSSRGPEEPGAEEERSGVFATAWRMLFARDREEDDEEL